MTLLSIENLACRYDAQPVFRDVSLDIARGEVVILLGANGSGKTTLLKALVRQHVPTEGQILLDGIDIQKIASSRLSQRVTLMAQAEKRDWPLTVEESVRLGRAPHRGWMLPLTKADRKIVMQALELTNLISLRARPITQLSGGEWRRMIFARALAQEAEIMLLDEPTAGLDLRYQFEVLSLIQRLARERGIAFVVSLHDLNQASLYADRLALLSEQKLLACGSVEDVLTKETLERAYGISVEIVPHPIHNAPMIVPHVERPEQ